MAAFLWRFWLDRVNSNESQIGDKVNSEVFSEIRSEPSLPVCFPCTALWDYFYQEDCGWYHFSKWESASAAWVIHLGSSDNFLWNMCVLFIPEGIPQHTRRDEYLWKGINRESNLWLKESCRSTYTSPCAARADKLPLLTMQLPTQSHHVSQAGIKTFSISLLH